MSLEPIDWKAFGPGPVIGVDEVGRGCLAGPVYAAAVFLNEDQPYLHYTDSKKISAPRRKIYAEEIKNNHMVGIGFASVNEISGLNILYASLLAMKRAVENLAIGKGYVLVDGNKEIPNLGSSYRQTTIVKGDLRASPIAAASIVAKVTRDHLLEKMAKKYPGYGFENHKGYATIEHRNAIESLGPTKEHRPTFAGVREFL